MRTISLRLLTCGVALGVSALAVGCGDDKESSLLDSSTSGGKGSGGSTGNAATGNLNITPIDGGEGNDVPGEGGANCGFTRLTAAPPEVNVLLVVDKSLSMDTEPEGFGAKKWPALKEALQGALVATQDKISFGLDLYPYSGKSGGALSNDCQMPSSDAVVVPVQAGAQATPKIIAALGANEPSGGTPTAVALSRAYDYFVSGAGKSLGGERYVLLATDGGPNCSADARFTCAAASCTLNIEGKCPPNTNCCDAKIDPDGPSKCLDDVASIQAVADLAKQGIKTFVVGIPGTEAYADTLDALAEESGVDNPDAPPSYFAVTAKGGVAGLSNVLETITTGLVKTCELQLEEEPPNITDVFVVVDGQLVARDDANGWKQREPATSPPTIVLQGATCEKLETEGAGYINVSYGCPNYQPPK